MPRARIVGLLVAFVALLAPPVASADQGAKVIHACEQGKSLAGFSQKAYAQALAELNGSAAEYSDCAALIRQASLAAASGSGGPGSGSGPGGAAGGLGGGSGPGAGGGSAGTPLTPAERQTLAAGGLPGGKIVRPQVSHANLAADLKGLPTPLLLLLGALAAGAVLLLANSLHSRGPLRDLVPRGPLRNLVRARGAH